MKEKSIKVNAIFSILKAFFGLIFPVITFPYASRVLLPEGIGKINFVNSIVDYFIIIAGLGISAYATRELSKVKEEPDKFTKLSKDFLLINFISTFISYALLFIAFIFSEKLQEYKTLLIISSIKILLTTFGIEWIYKAKEDFIYITIRTIIFQLVSLLYLFLFVHTSEDVNHYMIFTVISSVGSNICNIIYSKKYINYRSKDRLNIKIHLKPIFILFGTTIAVSIFTILDSSMLGFLANNSEVGYYSAATKINRMVLTLLAAINMVFAPRMSFYIEKDINEYNKLFKQGINVIEMLSIPMSCGIFLLAKPLTILFCGINYTSSIILMKILSPIIFIIIFGSFISDQIFVPNRKDLYTFIPVLAAAFINFTLNYLLIPKYGAVGAALSSLIAETFITIVKYILSFKFLNDSKMIISHLHEYIIATLIMGALLYFLTRILPNKLFYLLLETILSIILYFFVLLIFKNPYLNEMKEQIINKIRKN